MSLSYRDRVYCPFTDCNCNECIRRLTDAVINAAEVLKMPISQLAEKPDCFKESCNIGFDMKITTGKIK